MTESPRVLRGFLPVDPVADDCVLFNFIYTDSFGVQEERDARLALYGVVDCDGARAGRLCLSDLMYAIPPTWRQNDLSFRVSLDMFTTELYFEGKPGRKLSGQLLCCSLAYLCIVSAPAKKQGIFSPHWTVKCLMCLMNWLCGPSQG